jgi:hypothetical protein
MPMAMDFKLTVPETGSRDDRALQRSVLASTVHLLQHVFEQATPEDFRAVDRILSRVAEIRPVPAAKQAITTGREQNGTCLPVQLAKVALVFFGERGNLLIMNGSTVPAAEDEFPRLEVTPVATPR